MRDEQDTLQYLSLDGTCDVGRSIVWAAARQNEQEEVAARAGPSIQVTQEQLLNEATVSWDRTAAQRCLGYPPELIESSFAWWRERIHSDDRPRVTASLKRALFESETARYWSESYRFRVYDGLPSSASASASSSGEQAAKAAAPLTSMRSSAAGDDREDSSSSAPTLSSEASHTPADGSPFTSRSPTPRQQLPPLSTSPAPSSDERGNNTNLRQPSQRHGTTPPDEHKYITVLDQLYISRNTDQQPTSSSSSGGLTDTPATNSSCTPDRHQEDGQDLESSLEGSSNRLRHLPTSAIGSIFALEQRIKTSEAIHDPRSKLMRSISNLSASSNASSSATNSTGSNGAPASSSGSFVSVPSSAGAMQRQQFFALQRTPSFHLLQQQQQQHSLQQQSDNHPLSFSNPAQSPTSPVSSPSTAHKAFSFLDVEGVRTILENTQSGLTMVDAKGRPTYFNAAGAAITGYANIDELRAAGKDLHYALHHTRADGSEYPASECPIVHSMATLTRVTNQSDTFYRKDGSPFPVIWSCSPISKLGKSIGAVLEFRDVTEEKALEKDKLKATLMNKHQEITIREANASKQRMTQFLDYIAHELRNPLHGIAANIEFLRDSLTALQATFDNTPAVRPSVTPLQSGDITTNPSAASGSGLSTNSHSSSLRSSSATSSMSSQHSLSQGRLASVSPKVELPPPTATIAPAFSAAILPAGDDSPKLAPSSPSASFAKSSLKAQRLSAPSPHSQTPTPRALIPADQSPDVLRTNLAAMEDQAAQITKALASPPRLPADVEQQNAQSPKGVMDTITSIDDAAQKQFQAHFEQTASNGPPPWQAEDKKLDNAGGAMAMSPLLADIAKHTATGNALAKQQNDLVGRRSSSHLANSPQASPSAQPGANTRKSIATHPSASKEDLRTGTVSPASPSLSTGTILESEADTERPHLSNSEIQQVLQTSQSFITSIRECVFHATHITNNVLDLSRFEAGKVELLNDIVYPARVASLAVDMMMARAQEKEIHLKLDIPQDQILVRGDGTRLAQVFLNLLSNAIKFTPRGGQVTLKFRTSQEAGRILLTGSIIDTGMGMSKAEMSNLFQRFGQSSRAIQAEYGGTGLGLSICQEIVSLQGGKMSVESEKGHGSTFSFTAYYQPASEEDVKDYLRKTPGPSRRGSISPVTSPISEPGEATAVAAINAFIPTLAATITGQSSPSALPEEQQVKLTSLKAQLEAEQAEREAFRFKHILVAEDNGINQNIMKTYLKKLGYQFTIVNNGQEVLDTFVNKTHEVPIDVILMDCEMPVMDGRQATEHIRQHEHFRKNLVTPLDSPFNLQLGAAEINNLQATPPSNIANVSYSPPLSSPTLSHASSPGGSGGRRLHRTPIIGLSGNARQELVNQALASGMDDYVVKPFKLAELEKVLKKWEVAVDEQLVQRSIAVKAKEFLSAATASLGTPLKNKKAGNQYEDMLKSGQWSRNRSGSASSKSDATASEGTTSSSSGGTSSPKPIRPPLLASLSASRLPREHMLGYGSPERASSRPKLPSRLSNEWIHQASKTESSSDDQKYTFPSPRARMESITSETTPPAGMSPVIELPSPAPSPSGQEEPSAPTLAPSLLEGDSTPSGSQTVPREGMLSPRKSI